MAAPRATIGSVLRRHTIGAALLPLLVVELSLLVLYAMLGDQVAGRWRQELLATLHNDLHQVTRGRAAELDIELVEIARKTALLRAVSGQLLRGDVRPSRPLRRDDYVVHQNGSLYQPIDDGGASIFYAASTPLGDAQWQTIERTEPLDPLLATVVQGDEQVAAAYLNTPDNFSRYYPFIADAAEQFPPDLNMGDFNFFYAADSEHNPERKVVWTGAYLDPAGAGWMISSVAPVYVDNEVGAVVGLDVTIARLAESALDLELPYAAPAFLVAPNGALLGLNRAAAQRFETGRRLLQEVGGVAEGERKLQAETSMAVLLEDAAAARALVERWAEPSGTTALAIGGEAFVATHAEVASTGWRLAVLVRRDDVTAPVAALEAGTRSVGLSIVVAMALFYAFFFLFVYARSRRLAASVAKPLAGLTEVARAHGERPAMPRPSGIVEVDDLNESFRAMLDAVERHRTEVEAMNRDLECQVREALKQVRARDQAISAQAHRAAMGEMVASMAHHWRQPLATLQLLVDELRLQIDESDDASWASLHPALQDAEATVDAMNMTVEQFRALYGTAKADASMTIAAVVESAVTMSDGALKESGLTVARSVRGDVQAAVVPHGREVSQALIQLLSAARALAVPHGGELELAVAVEPTEVSLAVVAVTSAVRADSVDGCEHEDMSAAFVDDPIHLAVHATRGMVERLGGRFDVRDDGQRCRFGIVLARDVA